MSACFPTSPEAFAAASEEKGCATCTFRNLRQNGIACVLAKAWDDPAANPGPDKCNSWKPYILTCHYQTRVECSGCCDEPLCHAPGREKMEDP